MRVFNAFLKVLTKKLHAAAIYFVVFVGIAVVMTSSGDSMQMFEQTKLNICIFDEDDTPESRALCDFIAEENTLMELEQDRDIMMDALYYERVNFILTIREGYAGNLAAGRTQELFESLHMHDSYSTAYMEQFLNQYVSTVTACMAGGKPVMDAIEYVQTVLSQETEVTMATFEEEGTAYADSSFIYYFQYLPYILIAIMMNSLCPVLVIMNKKDIRYRTNCSGIRSISYTMQLFAGSILYLLVVWLALMAVGMFINGGMCEGYAWIAVLNSFVFALFSAALTIFVVSLEPSMHLINLITQVLSLGMSFLCGIFVDQSMLGDGVLAVARFLPAYWYVRVCRMLDGREQFDVNAIITCICIEAGFAAVMAIMAILVRRLKYTGTGVRHASVGNQPA